MKKIFLSLVMMMSSICLFAQETYEIKKVGSQYTTSEINAAFASADFCGFYFKNKNHIIKLDDGAEILLLGEMQSSGFVMEQACYVADDKIFPEASWSISPTGIIVRKLTVNTKLN
jgi:hypothetical protein